MLRWWWREKHYQGSGLLTLGKSKQGRKKKIFANPQKRKWSGSTKATSRKFTTTHPHLIPTIP
ncbi:hypothetical protein BX600DRAFT_454119 [Xylariales sp. PMI_506]|nr:hypothetical protein BX600DRAFT_454119 [Xylariales sp. PMI_506]